MLHGGLELGVEVNHVDGETRSLRERTILVVRWLGLDRIKRDEGGLAESLRSKVLAGDEEISSEKGRFSKETRRQLTLMHSMAVFS